MNIQRPESEQPLPDNAKCVFKGILFDVYQWEQELYDGSKATFEKLKREDTVVIIPSLPDKRLLFLTDEQPGRGPVLTFPAGRMDKEGEDPLVAAKRELLEETGHESDDWSLWRAIQPVTKIDWAIYFFVARNCKKTTEPDPGPGERITTEFKTLDEIIELVHHPRFAADDTRVDLVEAKYNPKARAQLEKAFFG